MVGCGRVSGVACGCLVTMGPRLIRTLRTCDASSGEVLLYVESCQIPTNAKWSNANCVLKGSVMATRKKFHVNEPQPTNDEERCRYVLRTIRKLSEHGCGAAVAKSKIESQAFRESIHLDPATIDSILAKLLAEGRVYVANGLYWVPAGPFRKLHLVGMIIALVLGGLVGCVSTFESHGTGRAVAGAAGGSSHAPAGAGAAGGSSQAPAGAGAAGGSIQAASAGAGAAGGSGDASGGSVTSSSRAPAGGSSAITAATAPRYWPECLASSSCGACRNVVASDSVCVEFRACFLREQCTPLDSCATAVNAKCAAKAAQGFRCQCE